MGWSSSQYLPNAHQAPATIILTNGTSITRPGEMAQFTPNVQTPRSAASQYIAMTAEYDDQIFRDDTESICAESEWATALPVLRSTDQVSSSMAAHEAFWNSLPSIEASERAVQEDPRVAEALKADPEDTTRDAGLLLAAVISSHPEVANTIPDHIMTQLPPLRHALADSRELALEPILLERLRYWLLNHRELRKTNSFASAMRVIAGLRLQWCQVAQVQADPTAVASSC